MYGLNTDHEENKNRTRDRGAVFGVEDYCTVLGCTGRSVAAIIRCKEGSEGSREHVGILLRENHLLRALCTHDAATGPCRKARVGGGDVLTDIGNTWGKKQGSVQRKLKHP